MVEKPALPAEKDEGSASDNIYYNIYYSIYYGTYYFTETKAS